MVDPPTRGDMTTQANLAMAAAFIPLTLVGRTLRSLSQALVSIPMFAMAVL